MLSNRLLSNTKYNRRYNPNKIQSGGQRKYQKVKKVYSKKNRNRKNKKQLY